MSFSAAKEREQFWHLCLLTIVLVISACFRFYDLDYLSLSANEIANLGVCNASNWLSIAANQRILNGLPFVYPVLLCDTVAWLGSGEFMARLPSAVAGTSVIFVIYRIGRDFFSPLSGLLSALLLATAHQATAASRNVDMYSFLLLFSLFNTYCFFHLLLAPESHNTEPLSVTYIGKANHLLWTWKSGFTGKDAFLLGFWCSGALAFYTSYMAAIPLAIELCVSCFYLRRPAMVELWKPMLVTLALWIPVLLSFRQWIVDGHFFTLQDSQRIAQILSQLLGDHVLLPGILIASASATVGLCLFRRFRQPSAGIDISCPILFICLSFLVSALVSLILPTLNIGNYLYWIAIFFLIAPHPVALLIERIPFAGLQQILVIAIIIAITSMQGMVLNAAGVFAHDVNADFRLATRMVHDDGDFVTSSQTVVVNSPFFAHYLTLFHMERAVQLTANSRSAENTLQSLLVDNVFYYLEYDGADRDMQNDSPFFQTLATHYQQLCHSRIPWIRITKFHGVPPSNNEPVPDCKSHLAGAVSL